MFVSVVLAAAVLSGCAVKRENLRLEEYESATALSEAEAAARTETLLGRVNALWSDLQDQKLSAYFTNDKIAGYFETPKELTDFIAIYASLMRKNSFQREIVLKYRVNGVKIERNGAIAHVDIDIWGRIYFLWYARIHEVQRWELSGGQWYLKPQVY